MTAPVIPRVAHFVFGLEEQREPFQFLHYLSIESCRRVLEPERIYFHHKHLPWGPWWERIRPHLILVDVDETAEVLATDYSAGKVPSRYRYAHHADFIRLDALIEHGGVYADIDTVFVNRLRDELFEMPFVIGREPPVRDERTGEQRPSLCNALLMAEPQSVFARTWRDRMGAALDGSWSNHSGFLSDELSRLMPDAVHVEPETTFFAFPPTRAGLARLLEERHAVPASTASIHLWAHLWWEPGRRDFSEAQASWFEPSRLLRAHTTLADVARPYLPGAGDPQPDQSPRHRWTYVSLDEYSGYGIAASRCLAALEDSGLDVSWAPLVGGVGWNLDQDRRLLSAALTRLDPLLACPAAGTGPRVVIAHLAPDAIRTVREHAEGAFLVGHTVCETDRLPGEWVASLNAADLLVVPSTFAAQAMANSQIATPVAVVPHVAPKLPGPRTTPWEWIPQDTFVFYTIGEFTERKGVLETIEAYLRAFSSRSPVLLVVKTSARDVRGPHRAQRGAAGPGTAAWAVAVLLAEHGDPPAMRLVTDAMTDAQIAALHQRGDCFVSLCRSEGWGLGAFDAAAHGNPVVITGHGGQLDYLVGSPYLVGYELVAAEDPGHALGPTENQRWAQPDIDHCASLLREIAADSTQARARVAPLAREIRSRYQPSEIATAFRAAVADHLDS